MHHQGAADITGPPSPDREGLFSEFWAGVWGRVGCGFGFAAQVWYIRLLRLSLLRLIRHLLSAGLECDSDPEVRYQLLCNRAAAYGQLEEPDLCIRDAQDAILLAPRSSRAFFR